MRKFVNWASIAFICVFTLGLIHRILSAFFTEIPSLPIGDWDILPSLAVIAAVIGDWDILPSLAVIAAGISGYKLVQSKKYIDLIDKGKIKHFPAFMAAMEVADKDIYKVIMQDYRIHLSNKIDEWEAYIEDEKFLFEDKIQNKGVSDFNTKEKKADLFIMKEMRDTLSKIRRGEITWNDVYQNYMDNCKMIYTVKYLLGELSEEEKNKILRDYETIKKLCDGGNTVNP